MPRLRPAHALPLAGCVVCAAILALHAALLPEAHWRGDDFICAAFARDFGWRYLWQARIDGWSPRPLSELIFYGYGLLADAWREPLAAPFLGLLWATLFATTLITLRPGRRASQRVLIGLAISCLFLLGHPVAQLFFWPAGAVAYLTTLAASSLAVFLLIDARTTSLAGILCLSASLATCAASSETGAMAAVPLAGVLAAASRTLRERVLLLLPAWLIAGFVFWTLAHHRMVSAEAVRHTDPFRHLLGSLWLAPPILLAELATIWPAKLCFILGLRWCGGVPPARSRIALAGAALALVLAATLSIAAGLFQFGTDCCERHDSLRQCWLVLVLAALSVASIRKHPTAARQQLGAILLTCACLLGMAPRLPAILSDLRLMPKILATSRQNWRSGRELATAHLTFRLPPPAHLAGSLDLATGDYRQPAAASWTAHGIMLFFGKRSMTVLPPLR